MRREDGIPEEILPAIFSGSVDDGENFQPFASDNAVHPNTIEKLVDQGLLDTATFDDGRKELALSEVIRACTSPYLSGERAYGKMPLRLYQLWNALDWRKPLATPDVSERFINKLAEEIGETLEALNSLASTVDIGQSKAKEEFISELGDLLFCTTAAATILGADVERGTAAQILDIYGNAELYPTLDYLDDKIKTGLSRRDELYPEGHYPYLVWNLYNHEETWEGDFAPGAILPTLCGPLINYLIPQAEADLVVGVGSPYRDNAEIMEGKLWVYCAFYARYYADTPLPEVVKKNMEKISGRVVEGSLDDKTKRTKNTL